MEGELKKADILRERLEKNIGSNSDVLSIYRKWLDDREIIAESESGFPSVEAYDEENIKSFIHCMHS